MVYKFFDKKSLSSSAKSEIISKRVLREELHKPNIKKLKSEKYTHLSKTIFGVLIFLIWIFIMRYWYL